MRFYKNVFLPLLIATLVALSTPAFATGLTYASIERANSGSENKVTGTISFDASYPTGGEAFTLSKIGLTKVSAILFEATGGRVFVYDKTNNKVIVYASGATTPSGTLSSDTAGTPAGTVAAPTFTGTVPLGDLNTASPAFSGTGQSSAGQVITTTDNQTMSSNQCAGMWFVSATHGPYLITSNTAVSGAPAVLTTYGTAPTTDAGTYKILKALTPIGTNSAPAFTGSALAGHTHTFTGAAGSASALAQVANTTDLSAVTGVRFVAYGK